MTNICLTVLIGLPGCGKTRFAATLKHAFSNYNNKSFHFIHVCYDKIMPMRKIEGDDGVKYKELRNRILNDIDSLLLSLTVRDYSLCPMSLQDQIYGYTDESAIVIVIDDNMYLRSMRKPFYRRARAHRIGFCQVYFKCSVEDSITVNHSRSSESMLPDEVINRMNTRIEEPNPENKWEEHSLVIDAFCGPQLYTEYFKILVQSLNNPETPQICITEREISAKACMRNLFHQSDIALRQIVNADIQRNVLQNIPTASASNNNLNILSQQLINKKKKILNDIKSGSISFPQDVLEEVEADVKIKLALKLFLEKLFYGL